MLVVCSHCRRTHRTLLSPRDGGDYICAECRRNSPAQPGATSATPKTTPEAVTEPRRAASRAVRVLVGLVTIANILCLVPALAIAALDFAGPERWWLTGFLLYLPRWPWAVLAAFPLPLALLLARTRLIRRTQPIVIALVSLWAVGPLMGLRANLPARGPQSGAIRLRVLTYNIKWSRRDANAIASAITSANPDLVQFQDADGGIGGVVADALSPRRGWTVRQSGQYIVASRWKLSPLTSIDISFPNSNHHAVRATLTPPRGGPPITVYNTHLLSARYGLVSVRSRNIAYLKQNLSDRQIEARLLATAIKTAPPGPALLTGDLNAPPSSLVKRTFKSAGLYDAFEAAGTGYGYTYGATTKAYRPYVRIDCVMPNRYFQTEAVRVGNDRGSDHCPVITDLYLPPP